MATVVPPAPAPLDCLAHGEGDPAYDRVHRSGRHFGRYGFDQRTWNGAVARAGFPEWSGRRPTEAPPEVQDAAATQLYAERGTQPWPPSAGRC